MVKRVIRSALAHLPLSWRRGISWTAIWIEEGLQAVRVTYLKKAGMGEFDFSGFKCGHKKIECHILGSGWSLNSSFSTIDFDKAFIIGFNFSFLKCVDPDLHFIENASLKNEMFFDNSLDHYYALRKLEVFKKTIVVFKNLSEFKNSRRLIRFMYSDKALFVRDRHYRIFGGDEINSVIKDMMRYKKGVPQAVSSIISLIFLARLMGFKRIIVHGLDFCGPHFYGKDLKKVIYHDYDFSEVGLDRTYQNDSDQHKTASGENGVGVRELLLRIKRYFADSGVEVIAATELSPSAQILGARMND
ncbi:MAG: hypothetical protein SWN10_22945 [Pseudomonadota bacterium]|nr:hypothetical protein [Pseudomonadota bacterium]